MTSYRVAVDFGPTEDGTDLWATWRRVGPAYNLLVEKGYAAGSGHGHIGDQGVGTAAIYVKISDAPSPLAAIAEAVRLVSAALEATTGVPADLDVSVSIESPED